MWSYPFGLRVSEVVADPATPSEALLQLPVLEYATLEALARAESPAARAPEVLARTVSLIPSSIDLARGAGLVLGDVPTAVLSRLLLRCVELPEDLLGELTRHLSLYVPDVVLVAAHPACTPKVLLCYLELARDNTALLAMLGLDEDLPSSFRILAALWSLTGQRERSEAVLDLYSRVLALPFGVETLLGLWVEWRGSAAELCAAIESLD